MSTGVLLVPEQSFKIRDALRKKVGDLILFWAGDRYLLEVPVFCQNTWLGDPGIFFCDSDKDRSKIVLIQRTHVNPLARFLLRFKARNRSCEIGVKMVDIPLTDFPEALDIIGEQRALLRITVLETEGDIHVQLLSLRGLPPTPEENFLVDALTSELPVHAPEVPATA